MDITNFKMDVLVSMVNALGGTATMKTFSQRSKAVERINKLAYAKDLKLAEFFDAEGNILPPPPPPVDKAGEPTLKDSEQASPPAEAPKADKPPKGEKPPKAEKPPKGPSIRSIAEALLLQVVRLDENKRKVGLSYDEILQEIAEQFPKAKTTVACLRWYAVHMRERGEMPPSRPRAVPAKAETEAPVEA